jgi:uncharacterized RDD family membrane protein YckC
MKCPKCDYLGFETGDRCKNCGYDFSLMTDSMSSAGDGDLLLREPDPVSGPNDWLRELDRDLTLVPSPLPVPAPDPVSPMALDTIAVPAAPAAVPVAVPTVTRTAADPARARRAVSLPLFQPGLGDDEPLIRMPAAPRPPLAVRRTPETPRLRAVPKPARRSGAEAAAAHAPDPEPVLNFQDEPLARSKSHASAVAAEGSRRLTAAAIDHAILLSIDAVVVYLTLQMAALTVAEWRILPVLPLLTFLGLVKGAYFCAFTLVGGQTIGKMAARIRVVTLDGRELDPARAIRRTLAGALSVLSLGLTFIPVLLTADRRAVHDLVARTRVIAVG